MRRVVVSQPMFLPWVGLFEQVRVADIFVHYDDVQVPQGRSFVSRVQIKSQSGPQWLTVPVLRGMRKIHEVQIDEASEWRSRHLKTLRHCYARAPFVEEMIALAEAIYQEPTSNLAYLNIRATERISLRLGLETEFVRSSEFGGDATGSARLLDIVRSLGGDVYITGHGARNYLDHDLFERHGVRVEYMNYRRTPYPQIHGEFDPHVTVLDLLANAGNGASKYVDSPTIYWKDFISG